MRKLLLVASLAVVALPGLASALPGCLEQQHDSRVAGTMAGAGLGAVAGGVAPGPGSNGAGPLVVNFGGGAALAAGEASGCDGYTRIGDYDGDGLWRPGPGHEGPDGEGHSASGYVDRDGNWFDAAPPPPSQPPAPPYAGSYGADVAFTGPNYDGPAGDMTARGNWLESRIHDGADRRAISRSEAAHDVEALVGIRRFQAGHSQRDGALSPDDRAAIARKLDDLTAVVNSQWRE
jgi:hypothetical protein